MIRDGLRKKISIYLLLLMMGLWHLFVIQMQTMEVIQVRDGRDTGWLAGWLDGWMVVWVSERVSTCV